MKYVRLLVAALCVIMSVQSVFAVPATEATERNKALVREHFQLAVQKYGEQLKLFNDVTISDPDYSVFVHLQKKGIMQGYPNGFLYPDAPISRVEFLKVALNAQLGNGALATVHESSFPDVPADAWFAPYVEYGKEHDMLHGYPDGTFQPDRAISEYEARTILGLPADLGASSPALRRTVMRLIEAGLEDELLSGFNFSSEPILSVSGSDILANKEPIRGIFVNWLIDERFTKGEFHQEMEKMRRMGITGITTEIGWDQIESTEGKYRYPDYFETFLQEAEAQGLWVAILLSPHYTPDWLFRKYEDIHLYDVNGQQVAMGEYMTFAPTSPAVKDQGEWQRESIHHYSDHPNVIAFFLSNEQAYGREYQLDYSRWAEKAWTQWRYDHGLQPVDMPRSKEDSNFLTWQRFRQDALNTYLNTIYTEATRGRNRFVPVSHKVIFYEATSAFAGLYGLHPTPAQLQMDIVGSDIYGLTPNVYPAQNAFRKPIFVVETNLPGDWDSESMYEYLLYQYMQGISIQSIFRWNPGTDLNVMFYPDESRWQKTNGIERAAHVINSLDQAIPNTFPDIAIVVPTNSLIMDGDDFERNQYSFDEIVRYVERTYNRPAALLWSDDLMYKNYYRIPDKDDVDAILTLNQFKTIIAVTNHLDDHLLESVDLQSWVTNGGELYVDTDDRALLKQTWIGVPIDSDTIRYGEGSVHVCDLAHCYQ